jgi:hypothetical protein
MGVAYQHMVVECVLMEEGCCLTISPLREATHMSASD